MLPTPDSETDHRARIAEAHAAVDRADSLISEPAYICNGVIFGNTAHPFVQDACAKALDGTIIREEGVLA